MKIRLHTKDTRWGIARGKRHVKVQLGIFRIYFSVTALCPGCEGANCETFCRQCHVRHHQSGQSVESGTTDIVSIDPALPTAAVMALTH